MIVNRVGICILLLAQVGFAQNGVGMISGKITDPAGGTVAGVAVQAKNTTSGVSFRTETSKAGTFIISQLPVGIYDLVVPPPGFTFFPYTKNDLVVESDKEVRVDIRLEWPLNLGTLGDDTFLTLHNRYAGLTG